MSIFNSLQFDDINSLDYGIYITGESVYDAPERDVEVVEIAGRNGNFLLDKGRWKNIEVTYHCGTFGLDQTEFGTKMRAFRNKLASKIGYMRLTDTYHPDEFRMGAFKSALEVDPVSYKRAGEFDVKFDCKPQRWLTSGETAVTVSDGDTLTNPTPYDASPLLMVEGYGTIGFNGYEIEIENAVLGEVELAERATGPSYSNYVRLANSPNYAGLNNGDEIIVKESVILFELFDLSGYYVTAFSNLSETGELGGTASAEIRYRSLYITSQLPDIIFSKGETRTLTDTISVSVTTSQNHTETINITINAEFRTSSPTYATFRLIGTVTAGTYVHGYYMDNGSSRGAIYGVSTQSILGDPTYIDCDLGDAYMIKDGSYISLNSYIDLGSDLPVLASGNNELSVDNTITELKIVPRWWIL